MPVLKTVVIDDEPAMVPIIAHLARREHLPMEVVGEADNGEDAIALIRETDPDLIFLDVEMPGSNGFEVMQQEPEHSYIIITAYEYFEYAQRGLRLGAKDILLKPIDARQFAEAVTRALGFRLTSNDLVNQAVMFIRTHYREHVKLQSVAALLHTDADYLSRLFKKHMGDSFNAYLHQIRIGQATLLLENTSQSVQTVAEAVGYENLNNFYKWFKQHKGCTPAVYRGRHAGGAEDV